MMVGSNLRIETGHKKSTAQNRLKDPETVHSEECRPTAAAPADGFRPQLDGFSFDGLLLLQFFQQLQLLPNV
jgi:hypothetical protein